MTTQKDDLTFREKALLDIIDAQTGRIITSDICRTAKMAKATALKYLAVLEAKGKLRSTYIGPSKVWTVIKHCPNCNAAITPKLVYVCPTCQIKKEEKTS